MKERPLNLQAEYVRSALAGTLTRWVEPVTRRNSELGCGTWPFVDLKTAWADVRYLHAPWQFDGDLLAARVYPRVEVGDRLWVRETWAQRNGSTYKYTVAYKSDGVGCAVGWYDGLPEVYQHTLIVGVADKGRNGHWVGRNYYGPWKSSVHMPRWASRITLEVTSVTPEKRWDEWVWVYELRRVKP